MKEHSKPGSKQSVERVSVVSLARRHRTATETAAAMSRSPVADIYNTGS